VIGLGLSWCGIALHRKMANIPKAFIATDPIEKDRLAKEAGYKSFLDLDIIKRNKSNVYRLINITRKVILPTSFGLLTLSIGGIAFPVYQIIECKRQQHSFRKLYNFFQQFKY
jgi:hypothetical protein